MRDVITGLDYFRFDDLPTLSFSKFSLNRGLIFATEKKTNRGRKKKERKRERIEVRAKSEPIVT